MDVTANRSAHRDSYLRAIQSWVKANVGLTTLVLSLIGYALVASVFLGVAPLPPIDRTMTNLLGDLIAVINTTALTTLLAGVVFISRRQIRRHRAAMLTTFALICLFLVVYLWKVGAGFEKSIVIQNGQFLAAYANVIRPLYLLMLAIHVLLSALAVPIVLYTVLLGVTHTPAELEETRHAAVGRVTVVVWTLSLGMGILTYWLLNHVYAWQPR
jgi:putative membrane protein